MGRRKQDENLIPNEQRTPSERRENAKRAGKASGEARRKKRSMKSAAKLLLSMGVNDIKQYQGLLELGLGDEDLTNQMVVMAAMLKQAASGNVRAAEFLRDTVGESPSAEINRENIRARERERKAAAKAETPEDSEIARKVDEAIDRIRRTPGGGSPPTD